jgi:hypothetical protein
MILICTVASALRAIVPRFREQGGPGSNTMAYGHGASAFSIAMALALGACGGGGANEAPAPVLVVSPTPNPTPTPTPAPTPTPPPPVTATLGPLAAGGSPGNQLEGAAPCVRAKAIFGTFGSGLGLLSLSDLSAAELIVPTATSTFGITLKGVDTYLFGWDGPTFGPGNKLPGETPEFDQFLLDAEGQNELAFYRNLAMARFDWVALGYHVDHTSFCPFALGLPVVQIPSLGTVTYRGIADGVAIVNGEVRRLFGSPAALVIDYATGSGTIRLELSGRTDSFSNFPQSSSQAITVVTGAFSGKSGAFTGTLQGDKDGLTGLVAGQLLGYQAKGAGIGFVLNDASGVRVVGAAAFSPE